MKKLLLILLCLPLVYSCGDKEKIKKLEDRINELEKKEKIDNGSFPKEISNKNKVVENKVVENKVVKNKVVKNKVVKNKVVENEVIEKVVEKVEVDKKVELNSSLDNFLNIAKEKQKKSSIGYKNRDIDAIEEEGNGDGNIHGERSPNSQLLKGRVPTYTPQPQGGNEAVGRVVVAITVDRLGNVIQAIAGVEGSTTSNPALYQSAKKAF